MRSLQLNITAVGLAENAYFAFLSDQQSQRLLDQHRGVTFVPDQLLMLEQDESQGLILFRNGIAKVRRFNSDGEETVLSLALARLEARRLQELNGRFNGGPMPPPAYRPHFATSHAAPAWEPIASGSFRPCRIGNWPPSRDWPARPHREPLVNGVSEASLRSWRVAV